MPELKWESKYEQKATLLGLADDTRPDYSRFTRCRAEESEGRT